MLIETLESRVLLSAASIGTADAELIVHKHSVTVPLQHSKKSGVNLNEVIQTLENDYRGAPVLMFIRKASGGNALVEAAILLYLLNPELQDPHAVGFTITLSPPSQAQLANYSPFLPEFIAPFGPTFSFTLNAKNPLKLYNITQHMDGRTLRFTGTMSRNLQKITGNLTIVGKNYHSLQSYTATPGS